MIGWRFEFGTLSDLSATIFSVFLLLLVLLMDTALGPRPPGAGAGVVERAPLDAPAMADLLYQRRNEAPGTRIDVTPGHITVVTPAGTLAVTPQALNGLLRAGRLPDPVSLYVFANEPYAPVAAALRAQGRAWREISVPAALRRNGPDGGSGWTADFDTLLSRSMQREAFVRNLAFILGGGSEKSRDKTQGYGDGRESAYVGYGGSAAGSIVALLTDMPVDAILSMLFGACGVTVIACVERRRRARTS